MFIRLVRNSACAIMIASSLTIPCFADGAGSLAIEAPYAHDSRMLSRTGNPEPDARMQFEGFSILPPQGENWIEGPPAPIPDANRPYAPQVHILFSKIVPQQRTAFGLLTVIGQTSSLRISPDASAQMAKNPRAAIEYNMRVAVETDKIATANSDRFRLLSQDAHFDDSIGYNCYAYTTEGEDRAVPGFPGTFSVYFQSYTCLAPSANLIVSLNVSQRVPPHGVRIDLEEEQEQFLKSLKFEAPAGVSQR